EPHPGERRFDAFAILDRHAAVQHAKRDGAIEGAGVDVDEAEALSHGARRGALPRRRRPVDRDHEAHAVSLSSRLPPAPRNAAANPGNDVATSRASSTKTGPDARVPRIANAMAIRWSIRARTSPPRGAPPSTTSPSSVSSTWMPRA